jgi:hypothetical protein
MKYTVTNDYSKSADPRRGYHDHETKIVFAASADGWTATTELQEKIAKHIALLYKDNMWCHGPTKVDGYTWVIRWGFDSGD